MKESAVSLFITKKTVRLCEKAFIEAREMIGNNLESIRVESGSYTYSSQAIEGNETLALGGEDEDEDDDLDIKQVVDEELLNSIDIII